MKNLKRIYLHVLSYASVIALSLITISIILAFSLREIEARFLGQVERQMTSLLSNFETQLDSWGSSSYNLSNNSTFKAYLNSANPITEYELVNTISIYSNTPMVRAVLVYNRDTGEIFDSKSKVYAALYAGSTLGFSQPEEFLQAVADTHTVALMPWQTAAGKSALIHVYPANRANPYSSRHNIYLLQVISRSMMDSLFSTYLGDVNCVYEIYQGESLIYSAATTEDLPDTTWEVLEHKTLTGKYRLRLYLYPSALTTQIGGVLHIYVAIIILFVLAGAGISVLYGIWSYRPRGKIEDALESTSYLLSQQVLTNLLNGLHVDGDTLKGAGYDNASACFCTAIYEFADAAPRLVDDALAQLQLHGEGDGWRCKALEYPCVQGIVVVFAFAEDIPALQQNAMNTVLGHLDALKCPVNVFAGTAKPQLSQISLSISEAFYVRQRSGEHQGVVQYQAAQTDRSDEIPSVELTMLANALCQGVEESARAALDILQAHTAAARSNSFVRYVYSRVLSILYKAAYQSGLEMVGTLGIVNNTYAPDKFWAEAAQVVSEICRLASAQSSSDSTNAAEQVLNYINTNSTAYDISLDRVAGHFGISMNRVGMLVKQATGKTFREYLIRTRMDIAADLLRETNLEIQEISGRIGYTSVPHFIKTFKLTFDSTPAQYRKG